MIKEATKEKISGWLNAYKPLGISSAKLVQNIKTILDNNCKVGHCGTLDPLADGVLPIAIGEATKLVDYLINKDKTYIFTIQFGTSTTTGDKEGEVQNITDYIPSDPRELREVCAKFIGDLNQKVPSYSAAKINGKRFCDLARKGQEVPERSRIITIYSLELLDYDLTLGTATYKAKCSKGTYIRVLAEDISHSLKSLGFVIKLSRMSVGIFLNDNSLKNLTLGSIKKHLLPIEHILKDVKVIDVDDVLANKIKHGQNINIYSKDLDIAWLRFNDNLLAVGSLFNNQFNVLRRFNL